MIARVCRRLLCRLFGHRLEQRTRYVRGGGLQPGAIQITRCRRCRHVEAASVASAPQFPFPRTVR